MLVSSSVDAQALSQQAIVPSPVMTAIKLSTYAFEKGYLLAESVMVNSSK